MGQAVVLRRRLSYNTKSNRRHTIRTPGGRLVVQYDKKPKKVPKCGHCKIKLHGITPARSIEKSRMCKRKKTVKRAYGGVLCHKCVREKIIRAFLIEEQKIVLKVMRAQKTSAKTKKVATNFSATIFDLLDSERDFSRPDRQLLRSNLNRLGGAKDDLRNHLLPPLLNSMNTYVTADEKSLSTSMSKAPFQIVTVVDPAIVSTDERDPFTSLICGRQNSTSRRYSSLSENVSLRTPKARRTSGAPTIKRALSSSARKTRDELPCLRQRMQKMVDVPTSTLRERLDRLRAKLREKSLDVDLPLKRKIQNSKALLSRLKREGIILRKKHASVDIVDITSPVGANLMAKSMAMKGGYAAKLAELRAKEKAIDVIGVSKKRKKKNKPKLPTKFKANLRDFKERIDVEGTHYVMEMYLPRDMIENTRKYNIDIMKPPKIIPNSTTAADMRDEYSNYCGQRKALKNWLFYV